MSLLLNTDFKSSNTGQEFTVTKTVYSWMWLWLAKKRHLFYLEWVLIEMKTKLKMIRREDKTILWGENEKGCQSFYLWVRWAPCSQQPWWLLKQQQHPPGEPRWCWGLDSALLPPQNTSHSLIQLKSTLALYLSLFFFLITAVPWGYSGLRIGQIKHLYCCLCYFIKQHLLTVYKLSVYS